MQPWSEVWKSVADKKITGTTQEKLERLYHTLAEQVKADGIFAEVGTYMGCSAHVIATCFPDRELHCYDTWEGIVHSIPGELSQGALSLSFDKAQAYLSPFKNITLHKGTFPDTFNLTDRRFAFVYSDTDTAFGTKATLDVFLPLMSPGGIIMFDDIDNNQCPYNREALEASGLKFEHFPGSCQAVVRV